MQVAFVINLFGTCFAVCLQFYTIVSHQRIQFRRVTVSPHVGCESVMVVVGNSTCGGHLLF